MLRTGEISDDLWALIEPVLPAGGHQGRPWNSHRLHRLTTTVEHQTLQIQISFAALVFPNQRGEDLTDELLKIGPHPLKLVCLHPAKLTDIARD